MENQIRRDGMGGPKPILLYKKPGGNARSPDILTKFLSGMHYRCLTIIGLKGGSLNLILNNDPV